MTHATYTYTSPCWVPSFFSFRGPYCTCASRTSTRVAPHAAPALPTPYSLF
ncbi:uncharacterized protein G2W53_006248 [Senna tora]|uniref:Uncharacterized protein n=1 Tax=Senna tora TaxID=362788 RepID=A0A835CDS7_9FABA|nr:uncharacterized protein G2W53_006248 [Senna tora]